MTSPPPATQPGARGFAESIDRLTRLWGFPGNALADICAVALILAIGGVTAYIGAVHTRIFGHDIFLLLDSGWRVINGQRPDVDFSPGVGPLLGLIMAAGLKLAGDSVQGVGYAIALAGAAVGLWGFALCRRRMAWPPALLTGLMLELIAVAPYPLGVPPNTLSHAMVYNRIGYAFLGLVVFESFQAAGRERMLGSISTGVVSVFLLFLKPSYGLVALAFAGWSVLIRRGWRRPMGIAAGIAASGLAMMAYLRFDFAAVLRDFQMLAAAKGAGLTFWAVRWALFKGLREFLPLAVLALFVTVIRSRRLSIVPSLQPLAAAFLLLIGGGLLLATNGQASGYPLNAVLAILLVEQGRAAAQETESGAGGFLRAETVVLLLGLACFLPTFTADASGLGYGLLESRKNPPEWEAARFRAPQLSSLVLYDMPQGTEADRRSNGRVYVTYVNDGMDLIRRVSGPEETVTTLDIFNPFSYAMLRRPARGGVANLVFNFTYNDAHKPSPEWLFGAAEIVMVPKHPSTAPTDAEPLFRNFLSDIKAARRLCAESDWWELYKRPSNLRGCPARP
jgi:hypothetical protein